MSVKNSISNFRTLEYHNNSVIQLIIILGVGYILTHLVWVTLIVYAVPELEANTLIFNNIGLGNAHAISNKWWTILTYAYCHLRFMDWLSNMLWLYLFANVVQNLIGHKQIFPLYIYSSLVGGGVYWLIQSIPYFALSANALVMGAQVGIMAFITAGLTLSFNYRIYFSDYFSVPLRLVALVFLVLMFLTIGLNTIRYIMLLSGAVSGIVYIKLIQSGYQPGRWAYKTFHTLNQKFTPQEKQHNYTNSNKSSLESQIDAILDKINKSGIKSLTDKERETLESIKDKNT